MSKRKSLQELTIKDNFMFGAAMLQGENCRRIVEHALGFPIERVEIDVEKSIVYHPVYKGIRLDAYAKDAKNTRYNIEMQVKPQTTLPKRSRYYQSQIDMDILKTGVDYEELPDTYVIFICDFDPFGLEKYRYTQRKICKEAPEQSMEDGAHIIYLSTKGKNREEVPPELIAFLEYVETPTEEASDQDDELVRELKETIKKVKLDREMGAMYMTLEDLIKEERKEAKAEGKAEGKAEKTIELIQKKLAKGQSIEQIAEDLLEEVTIIQNLIAEHKL